MPKRIFRHRHIFFFFIRKLSGSKHGCLTRSLYGQQGSQSVLEAVSMDTHGPIVNLLHVTQIQSFCNVMLTTNAEIFKLDHLFVVA